MSRVFILGGAGKIGRHLVARLASDGHLPCPLYRQAGQAEALQALGGEALQGDLLQLDSQALARLMQGCDSVVFTAGAGGKGGEAMTNAIDGRGLELSVQAARLAGIRRFLLVSAFPEAGRGKQVSATFENYMRVKKQADVYLAGSDLDWLILRPGTLSDRPATGLVSLGPALPYGDVSREDVAHVLAGLIDRPQISRAILELTQGETPIARALEAASSEVPAPL